LAVHGQIGQAFLRIFVENDGADRDRNQHIGAAAPMAVAAAADLAVFRFVMFLVPEVEQSAEASGGLDDDAPAVAPVSAIGAAAGNELFSTKATGAIAAVTGFDQDLDLIDECRHRSEPPGGVY
jgi:hypothetical protein